MQFMQIRIILLEVVIVLSMIFLFSILLFAQETTQAVSDSTKVKKPVRNVDLGQEDVLLEEIDIKGEIEQPRVSILPKRMVPELGELEFVDRSFENELKQGPEQPFLIKERVAEPLKVKKITDKEKEK